MTAEYIELHKLLKPAGMADSDGAGKAAVASGAVTTDGQSELRKTAKIQVGRVIMLGGVRVAVQGFN